MGVLFSISCFIICFTPSFVVFQRLIANDPLRIILFVVGAFFWLVSLLLSSVLWTAFSLLAENSLIYVVFISTIFQEITRGGYYILLHKAQSGLAKLASNGVEVSGIRLLYSSRHILAVVCGLGMGVMAALFLISNTLSDYAKYGVVGLPESILPNSSDTQLTAADAYFPVYYSTSCGFLIVLNVCWTISLWDGLHKFCSRSQDQWLLSIIVPIVGHLLSSALSIQLRKIPILVIMFQIVLLSVHIAYCLMIIRRIPHFLRRSEYIHQERNFQNSS